MSYISYLQMLILPCLLYAGTAVLCPKIDDHQFDTLQDYFFLRARIFHFILLFYMSVALWQGLVIWDQSLTRLSIKGLALVVVGIAIFVKSQKLYCAIGCSFIAIFVLYAIVSAQEA